MTVASSYYLPLCANVFLLSLSRLDTLVLSLLRFSEPLKMQVNLLEILIAISLLMPSSSSCAIAIAIAIARAKADRRRLARKPVDPKEAHVGEAILFGETR